MYHAAGHRDHSCFYPMRAGWDTPATSATSRTMRALARTVAAAIAGAGPSTSIMVEELHTTVADAAGREEGDVEVDLDDILRDLERVKKVQIEDSGMGETLTILVPPTAAP